MSEIRHPGSAGEMDLGFAPDLSRDPANMNPATRGGTVTLTQEQFQQLLNRGTSAAPTEDDYAAALQGVEPQMPPPPPEVDLAGLPDAARDPEGFKQGLSQVLTGAREQLVQHTTAINQIQADRTSALDQAWNLFQQSYPDLAAHADLVQLAATREMDALRQRGIDPFVALQHNMEGYVDQLAGRVQQTVNRVRGLQSGDGNGEYDRTDMINGGSPRPGIPQQRQQSQDNARGFVEDLKRLQREMGIY